MADQKLKIGDMLPGGLLTQQEWEFIKKEFEQEEDTKSESFRYMILDQCQELAATQCIGENENKCLFCGSIRTRKEGLCKTCYGALRSRGVLRQCGHTHAFKNPDLVCVRCGKLPAVSKGLCRNCFHRMKIKGFNTAEELINSEKLSEKLIESAGNIFISK